MKKVFAFIMAVLVLSFSVFPCADDAAFANEESVDCVLSQSTTQDEPHGDACPPFCICTCCAGFSITCVSTSLPPYTVPYNERHSSFDEAGTISIASTIWQPPQLL